MSASTDSERSTVSQKLRIAVPVESGEGLSAVRSAHFGHAAGFVLVDVIGGTPESSRCLPTHSETVDQAVAAILEGRTTEFGHQHTCRGH
jgi:predicted Fe-Mo cluster-binding NifX family protein